MPESKSYVVLIGSFARGNPTKKSDVDLVTIGGRDIDQIAAKFPENRRINWTRYTLPQFEKLYHQGNLFVFHVLREGRLLQGDVKEWSRLVKKFRVRTQFKREINKNEKVISFLLSDRENLKSPVAFLANFLRAIKQVAIFRLAERGEYVFAKREAIMKIYSWIPSHIITAMLDAEYILARESEVNRNRELKRLKSCAKQLFSIATANQHKIP